MGASKLKLIIFTRPSVNYWFILLGIAYSANIGGLGTLVGSPTNAIAAANAGIDFTQWLPFGLPTLALMLPCILFILYLIIRPNLHPTIEYQPETKPLTQQQWYLLAIFSLTLAGWVSSSYLADLLHIQGSVDSLIAVIAILAVNLTKMVSWQDIEKETNWGILLLFGGGLTLGAMLKATGTSQYMAESISFFVTQLPLAMFLLVTLLFVVFLTELVSNSASAALLIPLFMAVADEIGFSPTITATVIAIAAACAFMLPVATPPNAIAYGSKYIPQEKMIRVGFVANITAILIIGLLTLTYYQYL